VKNRELSEAFVEDVLAKDLDASVTLARVVKVTGGTRMTLLTVDGKETEAGLRGALACSKGAARRADNPTAVNPGSFVILTRLGYASQVIGVLSRVHVRRIKECFPSAPRGFFAEGAADAEAADEGFDWDLEEGEKDELDIDAI
jgi:hypothetical protein